MSEEQDLRSIIEERLTALPTVVQQAIASSDIQNHLRELSNTHKLHIDQWESLEHLVMLTLLGVQPIEDLEKNIASDVGVSVDIAHTLTESINTIVFEPIRQELERQLEHPEAKIKQVTTIEAARNQELSGAGEELRAREAQTTEPPTSPRIQPGTPPPGVPDVKVARPSENSNYRPGETSAARAAVHDDPYREPPV